MNNPYKIAMYMRVSKEDLTQEKKRNESESIANQRNLIYNYVENCPDLLSQSVEEYFDDGLSGANFERPQFTKMMAMLREKSCNCVIVKDFSRFGRNYIEVGDYLEQIFPFLGVRFISINDNFDSLNNEYDIKMDVSFKNLIHDYYVKDLSQKVRSAINTKILNGNFVPSTPFFGYKILADGGRKLVIDEFSSKIVKSIFDMATLGYTAMEIAQILNAENIPTPNIYRKQKNTYKSCKDNFWRTYMVYAIVNDERYIGKGIFRKKERVEIASDKHKAISKDKWIVISNNHEPIISEELFKKAVHCLKYSKAKDRKQKRQRVLYAKVKCHCCGYSMKRTNQNEPMYYCETPKYIASPDCVSNRVSENQIEDVIISAMQVKINIAIEENKTREIIKERIKKDKIDVINKVKQMQTSIDNINNLKFRGYEDYTVGKVSRVDFQNQKLEYDDKISKLKTRMEEYKLAIGINKEDEHTKKVSSFYNILMKKEPLVELTRELVDELIEKVVIYDTERYEVVWKFRYMFI